MSSPEQSADIVIVGAGPAGLSLACALAGSGLDVVLVDPASEADLAAPPFDGREIALTHASKRHMAQYGLWSRLGEVDISPLRDAWVFDRDDTRPLEISHGDGRAEQLGFLVPNHRIRQAAFEAFQAGLAGRLVCGRRVERVGRGSARHRLHLDNGEMIEARLVVAADGRFSATRRGFGIAARQRDFGRSMLVCRVGLEKDHQQVAWEWFGRDRTLALLPINGGQASAVITLPHGEIERLRDLPEDEFNRQLTALYQGRLGQMSLASPRCVYPLVGVWPDRLVAPGFAAIGDAAVGMHPVTAHGFNLGLASVESLASRIQAACRSGQDFAADRLLAAYQAEHRRTSLPLYLATGVVVGLYTNNSLPASLLRRFALRSASRLAPFRRLIAGTLTDLGRAGR